MNQSVTPTENDNKKDVKAVMDRINNRLKKYLGFKIPNQVLLGIISPIAFHYCPAKNKQEGLIH